MAIDLDHWDGDSPAPPKPEEPTERLERMARSYLQMKESLETMRKLLDETAAEIVRAFPADVGVFTKETQKLVIELRRHNIGNWNSEMLRDYYAASTIDKLPDHLKVKLAVSKRDFEKLPSAERLRIEPALTIEPGKPHFIISEKKGA